LENFSAGRTGRRLGSGEGTSTQRAVVVVGVEMAHPSLGVEKRQA
jgi:hypothetical protein